MTRLFLQSIPQNRTNITLDRERSRYLRDVLRSPVGTQVTVFDGSGSEYLCRIREMKSEVVLTVEGAKQSSVRPLRNVVLVQGILKGQKMDLVIRKAAEIGISRVIPVITERCQVRETGKLARWKRIASEASKQCRRSDLMLIEDVVSFPGLLSAVVREHGDAFKIVFYEEGEFRLKESEEKIRKAKDLLLFTGPEGGFSRDEVHELEEKGFAVACLGNMVLRAETASIVAAGIIQYLVGQFDSADEA
jgi:16S rRNA (uracil1498-N3)-methyltransferase